MFSMKMKKATGQPVVLGTDSSLTGSKGLKRPRSAFANLFALILVGLILGAGMAEAGPQVPLDLNKATAVQLEALPGIGEAKAAAILAVRDARGGFQSLAELESVRGIGPKLASKLKPLLKVGGPVRQGAKTAQKAKP